MELENRIRDAFDCVKADEGLKESTVDFLRSARRRKRRRDIGRYLPRIPFRMALGTACAMLTVFLCLGGYALMWIPVAYVSIDVNPSLELELNRLDRVIAVRAYNEDGETILANVSVKGMYFEDAIERIIGSEGMQPYLTQDSALTFTVATDSPPKEKRLLSDIAHSSGCMEHGGTSVRADMSLVEEAHENGLSLGKYLAYQVLLRYESDLTVQDCHGMSMSQIHDRIEEHQHGTNHGKGHGTEPEGSNETEPEAEPSATQPSEQGSGHQKGNGHGHKSGHGH